MQNASKVLSGFDVLGIDIENHHVLSYEGFVCLIQITTPTYETFIIDALTLRSHIKEELDSAVFSNPKITKVFHGCLSSDVIWMQRDFGI